MRLEEEMTPRQREILVSLTYFKSAVPEEEGFSEVAVCFVSISSRAADPRLVSSYKWLPRQL